MATKYVLMSYTVVDKFGTKTQMVAPAEITDTKTLSDLAGIWLTLGTELDAITDGMIDGGRATLEFGTGESGWKTTPGANSFTERSAIFNFSNAETKYKYGIKVPSIAEAVLAAGKVDLTNTDVLAFIEELTSAISGGGGNWVNTGLHALTALVDVFLAVRKYRKQLDRSSFEPGS